MGKLTGGGPQVKKHRHKVITRSAAALGTHGTIRFEDCSCGAFRLCSVSNWIGPARRNQGLTIAQACEFLHCSYDVVYRLLWKGLVHREKRPIPGSRRPGWYIPVAELNRVSV
jgi:Helix-turn-helix domain